MRASSEKHKEEKRTVLPVILLPYKKKASSLNPASDSPGTNKNKPTTETMQPNPFLQDEYQHGWLFYERFMEL